MDFNKLAEEILVNVGSEANVTSLQHCVTRLRFKLKDESKASKEALESLDGVLGVVISGGQYQVVIGNNVKQAFDAIQTKYHFDGGSLDITEKDDLKVRGKFIDKLIDLVTGIFTPILPALIGGGMLKALLMIATNYFGLTTASGTYIVLNVVANTVFSFLPILLAYTSAQKFKANPYLAVMIGITLCSTAISGSESPLHFLGLNITVPAGGYGSTVFPIILTVYVQSLLEKLFNRYIPTVMKNIVSPLLTLAIVTPLAFVVIGPVAAQLQLWVGEGYTWVYNLSPIICGAVLGGLWQVLVVFGLHWGIIPIGQINLATYGRNTINGVTGPSNWAQAGSALGVALKSKNKKIKELAFSAALTGFFSITEPAIYGINLKFKKPFVCAIIGATIGGGIAGYANSAATAGGPVGILSFPLFMGEGFIGFVIAMATAFVLSALLTFFFGYKDSEA